MMMHYVNDIEAGAVLCTHCRKLHPAVTVTCDRCGGHLHQRRPHALLLSWSFTLAGLMFLIPANLLPMMIVYSVVGVDAGTIMDGVIHFLHEGALGIAFIIFTASIFVPFFKVSVMFYLLLVIHFNIKSHARRALRLYRIIHFVGKWSMLDIFVVALMVGLVQFGSLASIVTGPAALAFALAVIMTMLATASFDPRLLFDSANRRQNTQMQPTPNSKGAKDA